MERMNKALVVYEKCSYTYLPARSLHILYLGTQYEYLWALSTKDPMLTRRASAAIRVSVGKCSFTATGKR